MQYLRNVSVSLTLFIVLLLNVPAEAQTKTLTLQDEQDIADARQAVSNYVDEHNIPGMAVSVYRNGEMIWSEGFGYADLESRTPVNPAETLFRVGSVSKTYTAAAVGLLMQQGKLELSSPVQEYVPYFPDKKYDISVEQVAGHIAGIRHYRGDEYMSAERFESVQAGVEIFKDDTLLFEPGSAYSYSSYGWNLISAVVEGASGEEFIPYMEEQVFEPLNMNHTMPDYAYREIPDRTTFYVYNGSENTVAPYVDNSYKWAGGGFLSTSEDMVRFGEAHLSSGFLSGETLERLMEPLQTSDGNSTDYGIGWSTIQDSEGNTWKGHSGGSVGGSTMFMMHPESGVIIAFAINRSNAPGRDLRNRLADIFLEE